MCRASGSWRLDRSGNPLAGSELLADANCEGDRGDQHDVTGIGNNDLRPVLQALREAPVTKRALYPARVIAVTHRPESAPGER
jgi:hypothetical protein